MSRIPRSLILDQGTVKAGYAIGDDDKSHSLFPGFTGRLITHGRILMPESATVADRVMVFKADVQSLIDYWGCTELGIENTMFHQQSGAASNALGALYVACQDIARKNCIPLFVQNPVSIKKFATGQGNATKTEVKIAVCKYFALSQTQILDYNHSDALAGLWRFLYKGDEMRAKKEAQRAMGKAKWQ